LVVIGVRDLDAAIGRYRKKFQLGAPQRQDDPKLQLRLAAFTGTPVVLASPLSSNSPLAARLQRFGEAPYLFVLDGARPMQEREGTSEWFGSAIVWHPSLGIGIR
jgi:hypothetical protein